MLAMEEIKPRKRRNIDLSRRVLGYRADQVLRYVRAEIALNGQAPSYRMIEAELNLYDRGEVGRIVQGLERRGLLKRAGCGHVRRISLP